MKAVRIHSFGGPDVLQVEDIPKPKPREGEVLIRVHAASVNPVDYKIRSHEFALPGMKPPLVLGRDVSGVVEGVGRGVTRVKMGDEVYALLDPDHGGYAEYTIAKENGVALKPSTLDHIHAAAVPLAAITAWQGLFDHGKLKAGERVLIHGAGGGVGHFAVQFARERDAYVIATGRAEDRDLLEGLGADEIFDTTERFEAQLRDIDLVLDLVAGETQQRSWSVLKKGGRLVSTLKPPTAAEASRHQAQAIGFMAEPNRDELAEIARLIDDGKVKVVVRQVMPLADARHAHEYMEREHVLGKVVLVVDSEIPTETAAPV
ncbi:MAG: oxidoreductase [Verrucomicrobia bacterium]|nr:oxidoreductase [Verrucomicrobiota bacterium]